MKKTDCIFDLNKFSLFFYNTLSEKDKRLYLGLESIKQGYHGVSSIAKLYGANKHTVRKGQKELLSEKLSPSSGIRKKGGGRKKK